MTPDPLKGLNDFVHPAAPTWVPQTVGWYVLFAVIAVGVIWQAYRSFRSWRANAYRRDALRELERTPVAELSALMKRTALAAWPRERVASLTGQPWLAFLSQTFSGSAFSTPPGTLVEEMSLQANSLSPSDERELRERAAQWIRGHNVSV